MITPPPVTSLTPPPASHPGQPHWRRARRSDLRRAEGLTNPEGIPGCVKSHIVQVLDANTAIDLVEQGWAQQGELLWGDFGDSIHAKIDK